MKNSTRPRPGTQLPALLVDAHLAHPDKTSSRAARGLPDEEWLAWKEAACESIFEWHGPQWEDAKTQERFAQEELLPYFKEGFSPLEAERAWWRALCTKRHRPPPLPSATSPEQLDYEALIEPSETSVRSVYDSVLIRNAEQLRRALALLEKRTDTRVNSHVEEMRQHLQMMEKELARRRKDAKL